MSKSAYGGRAIYAASDVVFVNLGLAIRKSGAYNPTTAEGDAFTGLSDRKECRAGKLAAAFFAPQSGRKPWLLYIVNWKGCAGGGLAWFCWARWGLRGFWHTSRSVHLICVLVLCAAGRLVVLGIGIRQLNAMDLLLLMARLVWSFGTGLGGIQPESLILAQNERWRHA